MAESHRILIVEDHTDIRVILELYLRMAGHKVVGVGTGQDALAAAASQPFDLIITDIGLPDIDGFSLLKKLRSRHDLNCISMSAYPLAHEVISRAQCIGHLTKPFNPAEMVEMIDTLPKAAPDSASGHRSYFQVKKIADAGAWTPSFTDDQVI